MSLQQRARSVQQVINQNQNHVLITRPSNNTFAELMVRINIAQETNTDFEKRFFGGVEFTEFNNNGNNTNYESLMMPAGCSAPSSSFP